MRYIAKCRAPIELLRWKKQNPQAGFAEMPSELKCGSVSIFVSRVVFKGAANHGCPSCIGG